MAENTVDKLSALQLNDGNEFAAFATDKGHQKHPFISKADWLEYKSSPEELLLLDKMQKKKVTSSNERYSLKENENLIPLEDREELRIVLIGKTGVGKSATGNAILGKKCFEDGSSAVSVTTKSKMLYRKVNGRTINVIDTPGLHDTHRSEQDICKEIARVMKVFSKGVHAFIYVLDVSNPRFTQENKATLEMIEENFGGGIKDFRLLVYSKADTMTMPNLDEYCKEQMKDDKQAITHFLRDLGWRIVAVNNNTTIPAEKRRNQEIIIAMVDKLRLMNMHAVYTSKMFREAEKKRQELEEKGKQKGWNKAVMDAVDAVIAADPDITKDKKKFNMFVEKHLEGKRDETEKELKEARQQRKKEEKLRVAREQEEEKANKERIEREREDKRLKWEREKEEEERKYRISLDKIAEQREQDQRNWILQQQRERMEEMEKEWQKRLDNEREEARVQIERQQKLKDEERERAKEERDRLIRESELQLKRTREALNDANMAREAADVAKEHDGFFDKMVNVVTSSFSVVKGLFGF